MFRVAVLSLVLAASIPSLACGGGGGDSGLITIHPLDLEDVTLTSESYVTPPPSLLGSYPAVVATINGKPISGDALVAEQVRLELGRRQVVFFVKSDAFPEEFTDQQLSDIESTDPLESLIDDELKRQAVERLGLLPPYEEAVQFTRKAEEAFLGAAGQAENGEGVYETLRVLGWPDHDWASNEKIVDTYRQGMGNGRLQREYCALRTPQPATPLLSFYGGGYDCSDLLRQEREHADIVYYVRWTD